VSWYPHAWRQILAQTKMILHVSVYLLLHIVMPWITYIITGTWVFYKRTNDGWEIHDQVHDFRSLLGMRNN